MIRRKQIERSFPSSGSGNSVTVDPSGFITRYTHVPTIYYDGHNRDNVKGVDVESLTLTASDSPLFITGFYVVHDGIYTVSVDGIPLMPNIDRTTLNKARFPFILQTGSVLTITANTSSPFTATLSYQKIEGDFVTKTYSGLISEVEEVSDVLFTTLVVSNSGAIESAEVTVSLDDVSLIDKLVIPPDCTIFVLKDSIYGKKINVTSTEAVNVFINYKKRR